MMEEIDRMDEKIEMEDTEDWSVVDIDSSDKKKKLTVVEYIDDIYAYYKTSEVELVSFFVIELCLVEYEMFRFLPSMLVVAAFFTAQCTLGVFREWNATWEKHSIYGKNQILKCSKLMIFFHQKAAVGKLTGVLRKYICLNMAMLQDVNQFFFC
ncbi:G2/mitotic-specific cyclin-2 [Capsicum annuum]|uniref:G2/mitotic-specific cyclin-2 n=1 Tax=Capsicum annuum TaxID=4072 RepID=A0A2G2Y8H0_CAPAN|nr:G2/mitotic-specific cyclin-2 [Capsicum annuum]